MQVRMKRKDASCCICKLKCQEDSTLALTYLILGRNLNCYPNGVLFMQKYGQGSINCGILASRMGGSGGKEAIGGKISLTRAINGVLRHFLGHPVVFNVKRSI